jgi:5-(carboxyamino)imidazole ribonucleotide mutase
VRRPAFDGLDALLSIVQMPAGIPVATMAVDGSANAALFAIRILARGDEELRASLSAESGKLRESVALKNEKIASDQP